MTLFIPSVSNYSCTWNKPQTRHNILVLQVLNMSTSEESYNTHTILTGFRFFLIDVLGFGIAIWKGNNENGIEKIVIENIGNYCDVKTRSISRRFRIEIELVRRDVRKKINRHLTLYRIMYYFFSYFVSEQYCHRRDNMVTVFF